MIFRNGFLYVANSSLTGQVSRFNANTGAFVNTFVAAGSGGLSNPEGMVFGPDGNLYVTTDGGSVLRYNGTTGAFIDTFVAAHSGGLASARGVVFGLDGNLLVTNFNFAGGGVLRYNGTTGAFIDSFVAAGSGGLVSPRPLVFGLGDNLYVGDLGAEAFFAITEQQALLSTSLSHREAVTWPGRHSLSLTKVVEELCLRLLPHSLC